MLQGPLKCQSDYLQSTPLFLSTFAEQMTAYLSLVLRSLQISMQEFGLAGGCTSL